MNLLRRSLIWVNRFDQTPRWCSNVHGVELEAGTPIRFVEIGDRGPLPLEEQEALQKLVLVAEDPTLRFLARGPSSSRRAKRALGSRSRSAGISATRCIASSRERLAIPPKQ